MDYSNAIRAYVASGANQIYTKCANFGSRIKNIDIDISNIASKSLYYLAFAYCVGFSAAANPNFFTFSCLIVWLKPLFFRAKLENDIIPKTKNIYVMAGYITLFWMTHFPNALMVSSMFVGGQLAIILLGQIRESEGPFKQASEAC